MTARGNRRESLFCDEQDRQGFLGMVVAETNRLARAGRVEWPVLVQWAEKVLGRPWTTMLEGHRDWGRDSVLSVTF